MVSFWLSILQELTLSPLWCLQHGHNQIGWCWPPSDYSIHQESFLSFHGVFNRVRVIFTFPSPRNKLLLLHGHFSFLHPAGSFSFPYHPLSLILALETHPSSLADALEYEHKPWHCIFLLWAGRLSPSSWPSSLVYFHFVKMVSNHFCRPLCSCNLWRKRWQL